MCIIIAKPAGVNLPPLEHVEESWNNNPHGFGAMWCDNKGKIKTYRTMDRGKCISFYKSILNSKFNFKDVPLSLHFRLATHGSKCEGNCHAFTDEQKRVGFQHNGILHVSIPKDMDITDSEYVFRYMILPSYVFHGKIHSHVVDNIRGTSDKFSIIADGSLLLFGAFSQDNGIYYSNSGYKSYTDYFNYRVPPVNDNWKNEEAVKALSHLSKTSKTKEYPDANVSCGTCRDFNCMQCPIMDGYYD